MGKDRPRANTHWVTSLRPLPIDPILPEVAQTLRGHHALVLEAPPATGKTTRFPRALLEAGLAEDGEIWVLEPRRLAARMAARRVAFELGQEVGQSVGYSMRFESVDSPETRIRFVTEGVLLRRLTQSKDLAGTAVVILDEFHERHAETDVALASLLRLQRTRRPDLKLAAMSATLDAAPIARHLSCPLVRSEGESYPVEVSYLPSPDKRPLPVLVAEILSSVISTGLDGDVLVFLPGLGEIVAVEKACRPLSAKHGLRFCRLHGSLDRVEQDQVLAPSDRRKVVFSTNVAETSVTIEGITTVIDSALVKEAGVSPWSGLPTLQTTWVSQASAQQRAGRAGRTRPGRCLRLVTRREFGGFSPFTTPELQRADLSGVVLALKGSGVSDPRDLPWLQPPPEPALEAAESLLRRLGALDDDGNLTAVGTQMLAHPTHPRLARVLQEADTRGVLPSGALVVSVLENPDPREGRRWSGEKRGHSKDSGTHPSDPILVAEELNTASVAPGERKRILTNARLYAHGRKAPERFDPPTFQALCRSLLAGYPDRVARRVSEGSQEVYLSSGGRAFLCPESSVRKAEFLVALEAREDPNRGGRTIVAQASAIEPEWLFDLSAESVRESREVRWNSRQERVEVVEHLLYDKLVLHEHAQRADQCPEAAELLAQEALKAGLGRFFGEEALERFLARMAFLQSVAPKLDVPDERRAEQVLRDACRGRASFRQLEDSDLMSRLRYGCSPGAQRALAALAPEQIPLPSGQRLTIQYPKDGRPFAKAAIQAFYGMKGTPTVGGGRVPVQLHLLAPSRRPAQITDDLPRFWSGTYELVRKELRGRYPKHYWPDDPANAAPVQLRRDA